MRVRQLLIAGAALLAAGCAGVLGMAEHAERTVLVDYDHDEVASTFMAYFPNRITVHPGDAVGFRQQWTGEGHSVTLGTYVDRMMKIARPLMAKYPDEEPPPDVLKPFNRIYDKLPVMVDDNLNVNQNGAQPCFLGNGLPPRDPATPCAAAQQRQPAFNGRQSYYNSGFIPYEGEGANQFRVQLSDDIRPGVYSYYCNLHSVFMNGAIEVVPDDQPIPSQADVRRQSYDEIKRTAAPLLRAYRHVMNVQGKAKVVGLTVSKPFAGWVPSAATTPGWINEFVPRRTEIEVGQSLTWSFVGSHTVSFNVPAYFSEFVVEPDGTVQWTRDAVTPQGRRLGAQPSAEVAGPSESGSSPPGDTAPDDRRSSEAATEQAPSEAATEQTLSEAATEQTPSEAPTEAAGDRPPAKAVKAGRWDGRSFLSSGMQGGGTFTVTFTRPGVYPYACLIHPRMVGEVVVR